MLGAKNTSKFEYNPIIREQDKDDIEASVTKPPHCKFKIELDYQTNIPKIKLYDKSNSGRDIVNVSNLNDVFDHM